MCKRTGAHSTPNAHFHKELYACKHDQRKQRGLRPWLFTSSKHGPQTRCHHHSIFKTGRQVAQQAYVPAAQLSVASSSRPAHLLLLLLLLMSTAASKWVSRHSSSTTHSHRLSQATHTTHQTRICTTQMKTVSCALSSEPKSDRGIIGAPQLQQQRCYHAKSSSSNAAIIMPTASLYPNSCKTAPRETAAPALGCSTTSSKAKNTTHHICSTQCTMQSAEQCQTSPKCGVGIISAPQSHPAAMLLSCQQNPCLNGCKTATAKETAAMALGSSSTRGNCTLQVCPCPVLPAFTAPPSKCNQQNKAPTTSLY